MAMETTDLTKDEKISVVLNAPSEVRKRLIAILSTSENEKTEIEQLADALEQAEALEYQTNNQNDGVIGHRTEAVKRKPEEHFSLPEQFDGFELVEPINRGSYGEVWKSLQKYEAGSRFVAIKILLDPKSQFKGEINNLSQCVHSNVVHLYGFGRVTGRHYLAMEYVSGGDILEHSDARKLDLRERLNLFLKICKGVRHLHRNRINHCDLKPNNILVDQEGQPKIADFGLSMHAPDEQRSLLDEINLKATRGTPEYASPEAMDPNSATDARADVYSLGVILFRLLIGDTPHGLSKKAEAGEIPEIENLPTRPSEWVRHVPPEQLVIGHSRTTQHLIQGDLDSIILRATSRNREDRFESVSDLANDVQAFLTCNCVTSRQPRPRFYRTKKFVKRSPAIAASLLGLVMFTITLCVLSLLLNQSVVHEKAARKEADESRKKTETQALDLKGLNATMQTVFEGFNPHLATAGDGELRGAFVGRMTKVANEIVEKQLGKNDDGVEMKKHLAETLNIFGQVEVSIKLWKNIRDDLKSRKGEVHEATLAGLLNLGRTQLRADPEDALETMLLVKQLGSKLYPPEHQAQNEIDHFLAEAYSKTGNEQLAFDIMENVHARLKKAEEAPFEWYIDFLNSKGMLALKMNKLEIARESISKAVKLGKARLKESHPFILVCRQNLVMINNRLGDTGNVITESREILRLMESELAASSPQVVQAKHQLATYLAKKDSYHESLGIFQEIIDGEGPLPNRLHAELEIHTIRFLFSNDETERHQAVKALESLVNVIQAELGPDHPLNVLTRQKASSFRADIEKNN